MSDATLADMVTVKVAGDVCHTCHLISFCTSKIQFKRKAIRYSSKNPCRVDSGVGERESSGGESGRREVRAGNQ